MTKRRWIILISVALVVILCVVLTVTIVNNVKQKKAEEFAQAMKAYYDSKIEMYKRINAERTDYEAIFVGDSLTDGCELDRFYGEYITTNRGIGGDTTTGLIDRLQVSVYDVNPKVIVLLIGGNDLIGGRSIDEVCANYEIILTGIKERHPQTKILWCSLTPMANDWAKYIDVAGSCNERIKPLAEKYGCIYIDLFTPLSDPQTGEIRKEYTLEGLHFTDEGYVVISGVVKQYLREILGH